MALIWEEECGSFQTKRPYYNKEPSLCVAAAISHKYHDVWEDVK